MAAPRCNRVTPEGEIVALALRGAWTGNRGSLHRDGEIRRPWASHHWLVCSLNFKDWWHEQWVPGRLTWLFFHDEAVAFAAGHRPCALCRRGAYNDFRQSWPGQAPPSHDQIDRQLHAERVDDRGARRTHRVEASELPDGAFVLHQGLPALVHRAALITWTPEGYGPRNRRPRRGPVELLTPPSSLAVLQAGYPVQCDAGAG